MDYKDRGRDGLCLCCGGITAKQTTLTSKFFSMRAWGEGSSGATQVSAPAVDSLFMGEACLKRRFSPTTSHIEMKIIFWAEMHLSLSTLEGSTTNLSARWAVKRGAWRLPTTSIKKVFQFFKGPKINRFWILPAEPVRLISDLPGNKYVFDVSGESPAPGVSSITQDMLSAIRFDLVVCAQMIEHATDPRSQAEELYRLVKPGGFLYMEVPFDETWRDYSFPGPVRDALLSLAKRFEWFNIFWDIYGTAFRVKFKVLPPLAFVPVREHLNYFTPKSLVALGESVGGQVVNAARIENLGTTLLIRKAG